MAGAGHSKNILKDKNSGRVAAEEVDDIDRILADIVEIPPMTKGASPPTSQVEALTQPESPEDAGLVDASLEKGADGVVESAAAKRKKKKKEKEREKKVSAPEDLKQERKETKVQKHVRAMQETLAKRKELEEKMKREEEEKLRKEEEERIRLKELERQAEEKKRLRKEKEKEKLLKKKLDGKLLTPRQKDEARRLEAMRNHILANAGVLPLPTGDSSSDSLKRPKYQTKKTKVHPCQVKNLASTEVVESTEEKEGQHGVLSELTKKVEDSLAESAEIFDVAEVEDDEWDAKSWDDADVKMPATNALVDKDIGSEREHEVKHVLVPVKSPATNKNEAIEVKEPLASDAQLNQTENCLRSPICCIMGHVDTGKTKLLDCIRGTNVQEGEAGGITQQIGATYFPSQNIRERTKELKSGAKLKVPGLLVIDTPGHESFINLRSRGSGLCDIAILVVDIMHGLEPQTIESLNLLKMRNTEFIIALNKVDRLYGWKTCRNAPILKAMKQQSEDVQIEFNMRLTEVITQFKEQGLNTQLYYKNKEMGDTFSIVPTSAISGEGIPDLLLLLALWTQKTMVEKLTYSNEVQCTVLEVKVIEGHGTTIDVVLVNGVLREGDKIVVCGMQGPIITTIRALMTPHPMKELRVEGVYLHHKEIKAAQGIKISAQGLEHAIAGTSLYVVKPDDNIEDIKLLAMGDMNSVTSRFDRSGEGVYVQASTLGSLEALLEFLKSPAVKIPVSGISIGPVHKKDVMKASVMLEKKKEYATILAFDVKVTPEAKEVAEEVGVTIFTADIIYRLFDQFNSYIGNLKEVEKKEAAEEAVFPCVLKIKPECVFKKKDPIVLGVDVMDGLVKVGTPICILKKEFVDIGRIESIQRNREPVAYARKGQEVAIKIVGCNSEERQKTFGRHFEAEDELVSHISRKSIDALKANFREDMSAEDWKLLVKLKAIFKIK